MTPVTKGGPILGDGLYTVPDVSHILKLPTPKVRRWIKGYHWCSRPHTRSCSSGLIDRGVWQSDLVTSVNFHAMIELYTFSAFRRIGVSLQLLRKARMELSDRYGTPYPFAFHKIMTDGKNLLIKLDESAMLRLGTKGQTEFRQIVDPFCKHLEFSSDTQLASRYWPMGKQSGIVVDPRHGFGLPTIAGTNIRTQSISYLLLAGERPEAISEMYDMSQGQIEDAIAFERGRRAA